MNKISLRVCSSVLAAAFLSGCSPPKPALPPPTPAGLTTQENNAYNASQAKDQQIVLELAKKAGVIGSGAKKKTKLHSQQ